MALVDHLWHSFVNKTATDVALHVLFSDAHAYHVYNLHRVVLTQAGYFRALFTSGFLESNTVQVHIQLPDSNVSRQAFEICLARLYERGPQLHIDQTTPCPPTHHNATPSFMLSLLAAASFLSIQSIIKFSMDYILASISPQTVLIYLNFALGSPISNSSDTNWLSPAIGLEDVATVLRTDELSVVSVDDDAKSSAELSLNEVASSTTQPVYDYGVISNRIGHACVLWLARWGYDLLSDEEMQSPLEGTPIIWRRSGLGPAWVKALISSDLFFVKSEMDRYLFARRVVELRRSEGVQADEEHIWTQLFESGVRYSNMVFEELLSISDDISPMTGTHFVPAPILHGASWLQSSLRHHIMRRPSPTSLSLPAQRDNSLGISFEPSYFVSRDILTVYEVPADSVISSFTCPTEHQDGGSLRGVYPLPQPKLSKGGAPEQCPTESDFFGLSLAKPIDEGRKYSKFPPLRLSVEFFDLSHLREKGKLHSQTIWHAGSLFNIYVQVSRRKGSAGDALQLGIYLHRQSSVESLPPVSRPSGWSSPIREAGFSPFSPTHGRTASLPLTTDNIHAIPGTPLHSPGTRPATATVGAFGEASSSPRERQLSLLGSPTSMYSPRSPSPGTSALPFTQPAVQPVQPYRDPRSAIQVYFSITVFNSKEGTFTKFSSAPDTFKIGQSWGWKSASLRGEDYLNRADSEAGRPGQEGQCDTLRAIVVLGVV